WVRRTTTRSPSNADSNDVQRDCRSTTRERRRRSRERVQPYERQTTHIVERGRSRALVHPCVLCSRSARRAGRQRGDQPIVRRRTMKAWLVFNTTDIGNADEE